MKKGLLAITAVLCGAVVGAVTTGTVSGKSIKQKEEKIDKFKSYYNMLNQWLSLKQKGKSLESYFLKEGYKTVAIYGMGEMGARLYEELKNSSIEVKYTVDKNALGTCAEIEVVGPEDEFESVDAMVVTATFAFDEIRGKIEDKVDFPIVSLEDVVYES